MLRKLLVLIFVCLSISSYFVAKMPITPEMAIVSSIFVIVFALPSYWAVIRLLGRSKGFMALLCIGSYGLLIESLALAYGFPYGNFTYTDVLGTKLFGLTPWTVAFAYPPILMLAYAFARKISGRSLLILVLTALFATAIDTVLDPAAVRLGFWQWDNPGFYYGVPLVNFMGWLGSGFVGGGVLHVFLRKYQNLLPGVAVSGLGILFFWGFVNLWLMQWWPVIIAIALLTYFVSQLKYDERSIRHHLHGRRPVRPSATESP